MTAEALTTRTRPSIAALAALAISLCTAQAAAQTSSTLTVRARGSLYNNTGPIMAVYVNGALLKSVEVKATTLTDYNFTVAALQPSAKVDVVFTNDGAGGGADRNLYLAYLKNGSTTLLPNTPGTKYDRGAGSKAFDGIDVIAGQGDMYWGGALRLSWPAASTVTLTPRKLDAARLLQQASFGPTVAEIDALAATTNAAWVDQQIALPYAASFVPYVESKFALGDTYRPKGSKYTSNWPAQRFWATAATSPDQLRKRVAFALHEILVVSTADSNLYYHTRPFAHYLDTLNKHALGNYRNLLQDIALSPVMGMYLSHMRNAKEDPATGRLPDENFARELMQLFTIGLHELKTDGTPQLGADGKPIETYGNADVMALAKVFTGWSWGFPDNELTHDNFRWGSPDYSTAKDRRIDLQPMKAYPGQHSTAEKKLFAGKAWAVTIAAGGSADADLRVALDTLFNHPNVGPFIGRQLIQHLVTSNPSPAYIGRVAAVFNNNGRGVRGDLGAVVRAILLDSEARAVPVATSPNGKLREPVLRLAHWLRSFGATSVSGEYMMTGDLDSLSQRQLAPVSVFSYFRPGYIPAGTAMATSGSTAPEFQIVNESTTAAWVNLARSMAGSGIGWTGTTQDMVSPMTTPIALINTGDANALIEHLNLLLFAGTMSAELKFDLLDAIGGVGGTDANSQSYRARIALFMALASPEYLVQR
ncbi:DUF1800 family protein [Aquabacterium sp.]|uniref:DUF1800 family protein n=1 Tax=Aquabacterium sp. TaxID=1872578 RepID=UPI002CD79E0D|nr:DUF1800 family protein [Aquabacterium sp.]HSW06448.1 DUF1800 family protein [Aquabacterium sp.]